MFCMQPSLVCPGDGNIFNLRMLQAKTKVQTDVLDELLYKNASSEGKASLLWRATRGKALPR